MSLTVRWAAGSPPSMPLPRRSIEMLGVSLLAGWRLWPDARRVLQVNQGPDDQREVLFRLGERMQCDVIDGLDLASTDPTLSDLQLDRIGARAWWKMVPGRLDPDGHELWVDADNILWAEPPAVLAFRNDPDATMLVHADVGTSRWPLHNRGPWHDTLPDDLNLNSGLFGFGPGVEFDPPLHVDSIPHRDTGWGSQQGWVAANWLHFASTSPSCHRVGLDEVVIPRSAAQATTAAVDPHVHGLHLIEHAFTTRDHWSDVRHRVRERVGAPALRPEVA